MSVVRLRAAVALLGRFPALAGVDLDVHEREIVVMRGPNGAGKSTLLRLCAGLVRLESGSGQVLGRDLLHDRAAIRRRVGLLGHDTALYDDLTVGENLDFWARASRVPTADIAGALERLQISARLVDVTVQRLSAGQRRRVALAAVVVRRPELWLLDEPHSGLDQTSRDLVDELVVEAATSGAAVIVASHDMARTAALATREITVAGGTVVANHDGRARSSQPTPGDGTDVV